MYFKFSKNISKEYLKELCEKSQLMVDTLNGYQRLILPQDRKVSLGDITTFAKKHNIRFRWHDFSADGAEDDKGPAGLLYCIKDSGIAYYRIFIDKRIKDLDDGTELGKRAMKAALKESLLHELCHVLLSHKGAFTFSRDASQDIISKIMWKNQIFIQQEEDQDLEAELLATIIGFWPIESFKQMYVQSKFDLRSIADDYKMTIDSVAQWALIQFYQFDQIHYIKRIESQPPFIVASFGKIEGGDVFQNPNSAASKSAIDQNDAHANSDKYTCRAFYDLAKYVLDTQANQIVVFGRLINKVYDL